MSFFTVHPIITYIFLIFAFITIIPIFLHFIPKKFAVIGLIDAICQWVAILGYAILSSFFIIFLNSAGYLFNLDLLLNIFIIGYFIYVLNHMLKTHGKLVVIVMVLTPFLISFVIFYFLFNGEKIYKLSPHCENTSNPKIKYCVYNNGTYLGELRAFKRHGIGTYNWNSGKIYSNKKKNGLMDGFGEMTLNGQKTKGKWKKHKRVDS